MMLAIIADASMSGWHRSSVTLKPICNGLAAVAAYSPSYNLYERIKINDYVFVLGQIPHVETKHFICYAVMAASGAVGWVFDNEIRMLT